MSRTVLSSCRSRIIDICQGARGSVPLAGRLQRSRRAWTLHRQLFSGQSRTTSRATPSESRPRLHPVARGHMTASSLDTYGRFCELYSTQGEISARVRMAFERLAAERPPYALEYSVKVRQDRIQGDRVAFWYEA